MRRRTLETALILTFVVAADGALAPTTAAQGDCVSLSGTIAGEFIRGGPQGNGWYAKAYLSFGRDDTVIVADLFDRNNGRKQHPSLNDPSGNFAGDEILTFSIDAETSLVVDAHFIGVAGSTPYAYAFNEVGKIVEGTGWFGGATGNVSIHGSFVKVGAAPNPDYPWLWIAQMTGSVCRLQ